MVTQHYDIPSNVILLAPRNPPAAIVKEIWSHVKHSFLRIPRQTNHSIAQALADQLITDFKDLTTFTPNAVAATNVRLTRCKDAGIRAGHSGTGHSGTV